MFYHAALFFDYANFAQEANPLAYAVYEGNLIPLHTRARMLASRTQSETYVLLDCGEPLYTPQPLEEVHSSPYKNSTIGDWFMIIMSQYVEPQLNHIGYNWRILSTVLEELNWSKNDIKLLFAGLPLGELITSESLDEYPDPITHTDPFWIWIRPDYSFGRGGWLSIDECDRLRVSLIDIAAKVEHYRLRDENLTEFQKEQWEQRLRKGYANAVSMLDGAIKEGKGLYMVVLWQWDDEEE